MRTYERSFREEAVKLGKEIGTSRAARELGIPENTLSTWMWKDRNGKIVESGNPQSAIGLAQENKRLERELRETKRANQILKEAMAFLSRAERSKKSA